jgi:hypothetical protein
MKMLTNNIKLKTERYLKLLLHTEFIMPKHYHKVETLLPSSCTVFLCLSVYSFTGGV